MKIRNWPSALDSTGLTRTQGLIHTLLIVFFAAIFCLPYLIHGLPTTGDAILHATYQHNFSGQFWQGDIYPRWLVDESNGYGSPIFLIQYPLPYWITALLRPLLGFAPSPYRESRELGVYCFLVLATSGLSAYFWFRRNHAPMAAMIAGIFYMSLPFVLGYELYTNFALGQFTVFAWMPLTLACCENLGLNLKQTSSLGIVWALLVLSNFLAALLFLPVVAGYALAWNWTDRTGLGRRILAVLLALAIGSCLAGAYLIPFIAYKKLFDVQALLSLPGYELSHYLSFVRLTSIRKPMVDLALFGTFVVTLVAIRFAWKAGRRDLLRVWNLGLLGLGVLALLPGLGESLIRLSGLKAPIFKVEDFYPERLLVIGLMTFALGVLAYSQISDDETGPNFYAYLMLLVAAYGSFFLMLPWSAFVWKALPVVARAVQFPSRLGVPLSIASACLVAAAIEACLRRQKTRSFAFLVVTAIVVNAGGILAWRADWTWFHVLRSAPQVRVDESLEVDHAYRMYISPENLGSFLDLNRRGVEPRRVEPISADRTTTYTSADGFVEVTRQSPRRLLVSYTATREARAEIGLVYSPLWIIQPAAGISINSAPACSKAGLVELPLTPGHHELALVFDTGWPERCGWIVTLLSVLLFAIGLIAHAALSRARIPSNSK